MTGAVMGKSLRDRRRGLLGWSAGVAALVALQMAVYPTVRDSGDDWKTAVDSFPEVLRKMLRITDYTSEAGYLSTELLSFVVPFVFLGLGCSWGARLTAEDEENGTADIILGLPISRHRFFLGRVAAAVAAVILAGAVFALALVVGGRILSMSVPVARFAQSGVVVAAVGLLFMSVAALAGAATGRRGIAMGVSMSTGVATFVLYSLAPLVDILGRIEGANPWTWTIGSDPLSGGLDIAGLTSLLAVAVAVFSAAARVFAGREIRS